jgi:threonine-phosphate decarboxylase
VTLSAHGGDLLRRVHQLGLSSDGLVDFSASINPLGTPEGVLKAAQLALLRVEHYPEIDALSLVEALATYHGLPRENLLAGSGATELLSLFPKVFRPRRALLVTPAFSEYERSLRRENAVVDFFSLSAEQHFQLDIEKMLPQMKNDTDLVLLANPGNPSGAGIAPQVILDLADRIRGKAMLAVDEAFVDFSPQRSVIKQVADYPNLVVFRSLTKFYAIPGLRAGYMAGPAEAIARLVAAKDPWTLSTPAIEAAKTCLAEESHRQVTLERIPLLRQQLGAGLSALGCRVFPSEANYLLMRLPGEDSAAGQLCDQLLAEGVLARDCSNFHSLDHHYLRVAVRCHADNSRLLGAMQSAFKTFGWIT